MQYEEVLENGVYVKKYLGNKKKEGKLSDDEKSYYLVNRKVDKVIDGLFITNADGAAEKERLKEAGITHIINAATSMVNPFPDDFKYLKKEFPDTPDAPLLEVLDETVEFIHQALTTGGKVLVHCSQGISRSASIVIGYLIYAQKLPYAQAFMITATARPIIQPNYGFEQQLIKYQEKVLGNNIFTE